MSIRKVIVRVPDPVLHVSEPVPAPVPVPEPEAAIPLEGEACRAEVHGPSPVPAEQEAAEQALERDEPFTGNPSPQSSPSRGEDEAAAVVTLAGRSVRRSR